ncbi:MAG: SufB/SufD family protein [Qingshengfaniella sp.]
MALPQHKLAVTEARLAALGTPESGGCLGPARTEALARLQAMGLPGRRDEYWKYTDARTLTQPEVPQAGLLAPDEVEVFHDVDRVRLVFVDGVFDPAQSDDPAMGGVTIERLADIAGRDIHWARDFYGTLEARGQHPVARPLAALNTAYATDGIVISATGKAEKPVALVYVHNSETSDAILHHLIRIEPGAELTVLERGPAAARFNKVMEVDVAEGGTFHHVRAQGRDHERRAATHIFARLAAKALFKTFTLTVNGVLTRNECVVELLGDGAVAHIAGAALGDGDFHGDDTVFVTHDAVGCESRQVFKKVLRNGATGVFQGKILVKDGAQQTDGYQISQALMLDDDSQFLAKPELEIYADDVACSHGSTSGALDSEALFYLRSRGVPLGEATDILTLAFIAEAMAEINDPRLAEDLQSRLEGWLARHRG